MKIKILTFIAISFLLISGVLPHITGVSSKEVNVLDDSDSFCYGFVIPVDPDQSTEMQMEISKIVNELLSNDIEVFWITNQINVSSKALEETSLLEVNTFEKGSYIAPFNDNQSKNAMATNIVFKYHIKDLVTTYKLMESIDNIEVYQLVEPKIAIHNGPAIDAYSYTSCLRELGFQNYKFISYNEIPDQLNNEDFNVFILGGGIAAYSMWSEIKSQLSPVADGTHKNAILSIKDFINNGGGYVASCYGQYLASKNIISPIIQNNLVYSKSALLSNNLIGCNYTTQFLKEQFLYNLVLKGGMVVCKIKNFDNPVTYGLNEYIPISHFLGPFPKICGEDADAIAVFHNITEANPSNTPRILKKMMNRMIEGTPNIISTKIGKGKVVTFSSHPEKYHALEKYSTSYASVRLVHNALFYVTSKGPLIANIEKCLNFSNLELEIDGALSGNVSDLIELQCSVNNGSSPYAYLWDFGDETTSIISNPSHQYLKPNEYLVTLTVIDNNSNIDTSFFEINISGEPAVENRPPNKPVESYGNKRIGLVREGVFFRFITIEPDGDLFQYKLKVDNDIMLEDVLGCMMCESNQSFEFFVEWSELGRIRKTGNYTLRVKAIDVHGAESEWSDPVEITITRHPFIARLFNR